MSRLSPPGVKREPLAKSLPASSASTNWGISAGSFEPSASIETMIWPLAAAKPQASALPLPMSVCSTTRMSGRIILATVIVSSTECPSTSTTSSTMSGIRVKTCGRLLASLSVGITTLIVGLSTRDSGWGESPVLASSSALIVASSGARLFSSDGGVRLARRRRRMYVFELATHSGVAR
jgi:hypothetical protein